MKVIIDRFEGNFAVCEKEDKQMLDIKKSKIPIVAREGDVLNITNDKITIDFEETKEKRREIEKLTEDLWK
ncbi:DUF3006 domain-containing protein [Clostridium sp.]|uniref:DUF3006 domain-containing protein n=1 Tax=Clostridium sp. TaxID=1506 RepID=UPI001A435251|nr:DUF3006 domain-containing protein [Clostridium sp.]MBK5241427.1 DUF3006 domain-containing protein [Clostridium sp.]